MKCVSFSEYGPPSVLKLTEISSPTVTSPSDIIVRVKAGGLNPIDCKLRGGHLSSLMPVKFPAVLGLDYAGVVVSVGTSVSHVKVDDEVSSLD
jgi:NADPH:quinone reductase-like Zn-dependent oxidoreductase